MCTYIHTYTYTYIYIHIYMDVCVCVCICVCACVYVHVCIHKRKSSESKEIQFSVPTSKHSNLLYLLRYFNFHRPHLQKLTYQYAFGEPVIATTDMCENDCESRMTMSHE